MVELLKDFDATLCTRVLFLVNQLLKDEDIRESVLQRIIAEDMVQMVQSLIQSLSELSLFEECLNFFVQLRGNDLLTGDILTVIQEKMETFKDDELYEIQRLLSILKQ